MSSKSKLNPKNPRFYSSTQLGLSNWVFLEESKNISLGTVPLKWRGIIGSTYYHKEHFGKPIRNTWCVKHKKLTFFMFEKYLWFLRFWAEKLFKVKNTIFEIKLMIALSKMNFFWRKSPVSLDLKAIIFVFRP